MPTKRRGVLSERFIDSCPVGDFYIRQIERAVLLAAARRANGKDGMPRFYGSSERVVTPALLRAWAKELVSL